MIPAPLPDPLDLTLLEILQDDIPLVSRPWAAIGERLGLTEDAVLARVQHLADGSVILGVTPILDPRHMGINAATLVAIRVPPERVEGVARIISTYREVSHNYRRDHEYAIWFTLTAPDMERLGRVLADIRERAGIPEGDILNLPTVRKVKIDLRFSFAGHGNPGGDTDGQH